jgi:hypothetical protein
MTRRRVEPFSLGRLDDVLGFLARASWRRGRTEGRTIWLVVAVGAFLWRRARRRPRGRTLLEQLRPGETLVISHLARSSRRGE